MERPVDWTALEQGSPLLAVMPEATRRLTRRLGLAGQTRLFARGDRPKAMYFVLSGEVHLLRRSPGGSEVVLQRARHDFLAEASLDQAAYHCDALAVMPSELLAIPRRAFQSALDDDVFRVRWIAHLTRELRRVRAQAERLSLKTAEERIIHYLETEGEEGAIRLTRSRKDWAAELGLSHEALYRNLARMQSLGGISIDGSLVTIVR
jgi:CRP-like cAMP-binding protein